LISSEAKVSPARVHSRATRFGRLVVLLLAFAVPAVSETTSPKPRILILAGPASHASGEHEFPQGVEVLRAALAQSGQPVDTVTHLGWPADANLVRDAELVVLYSDGLEHHVARGQAEVLRKRFKRGRALAVLHFALEPPTDDVALAELFDLALGGRFEANWSVNPIWVADGQLARDHPVTRGVHSLRIEDEWYYHLRFRSGTGSLRPVLTAVPPAKSLGDDGPRSGNPAVRAAVAAGEEQTLAWTFESAHGARGFGFTGGHFHRNWYHDTFRRLVLNGILWAAGIEVPPEGVTSPPPTLPLHETIERAIARGDLDDVRRHLAHDPRRIEPAAPGRLPPLHQAVLRRQTAIALFLIEAGAYIDALDTSRRTPLHVAVIRDETSIVPALLEQGAALGWRDQQGWTPLHHAAARNSVEIAQALLNAGADPNALSEAGGTALHEAAAAGATDVARLLLAAGVDPKIRSTSGATARDLAQEYRHPALLDLLP
jgi:hypothetical protein